jgi:hypothetical protein
LTLLQCVEAKLRAQPAGCSRQRLTAFIELLEGGRLGRLDEVGDELGDAS